MGAIDLILPGLVRIRPGLTPLAAAGLVIMMTGATTITTPKERYPAAVVPARAVGAGAQVAGGPMGQLTDQFWGDRTGTLTDPHGYNWTIATHKEDLSRQEIEQRQAEWMKKFAPQPTHG